MFFKIIKLIVDQFFFFKNLDLSEQAAIWFENGLRVRATGVWFLNKGLVFIRTEDRIKKNVRGRWN